MELAAFTVIGLLVGLGINYLADVLPITRKFTRPVCIRCNTAFSTGDYLLGRKCRSCDKPRSWRYPVVLIASAVAAAILWIIPVTHDVIWPALLLTGYFGLVAVIDLEHRLVLHPVSIFGAFLGAAIGIGLHGVSRTLIGGVVGFGFMLALYWLGGVFGKWMARRRGEEIDEVALGFGDVNLAGICGLLLGWPGVIAGLVAGILLGGFASLAVIAVQLIRRKYTPFTAIPYAPFLILGTVILLTKSLSNLLSN